MSLIMDALEKVQRERQEISPQPVMRPETPRLSGVSVRENFFIPPAVEHKKNRSAFWIFGGVILAGTAALFLFLFRPGSAVSAPEPMRPVPAVIHPGVSPGVLRGIVQDSAGSFCLIGDQILKKGDSWRGYTVDTIGLRSVTLRNEEDRTLTLQLQE